MDGSGSSRNDTPANRLASLPLLPMPKKPQLRQAIADGHDPARAESYDLLRTRILSEVAERSWTRIGITQAHAGPAAPLTALNLALSESRRHRRRVALVDLDVARQPVLKQLDAPRPKPQDTPRFGAVRLSDRLALVAVAAHPAEAATMLLNDDFASDLTTELSLLAPDVVLMHLPPILDGDAGLAALPLVECVLLAVNGRADIAADLRSSEARITRTCPILGLFLHDAEV